ncbi:ClpA/ClpB-like protein [Streptomyces sp. PanSC19]|uniref:hypothetical protein n=1 Tax=Streptomyces sp. PanSC19 TaxID=1520455 RepID=UPI000FB4D7B3|nr:hypothetical protein [Streptomyces sp. PanSC19]ROQ36073.1 ClpA/ClpB-like protein [Streptomyces sp. PanSC19]
MDLLTEDLRHRLADRRLELRLTEAARRHIAAEGFDPVHGARPLRRFIRREVETRIGRALLAGDIPDGTTITLDAPDGRLTVTWTSSETGPPPRARAA